MGTLARRCQRWEPFGGTFAPRRQRHNCSIKNLIGTRFVFDIIDAIHNCRIYLLSVFHLIYFEIFLSFHPGVSTNMKFLRKSLGNCNYVHIHSNNKFENV